ncbi:hypothetical protein [Planctomicrobium sp. SH664]|uniref:hypothetical protein n=1 Tax=Planctomicrobium sp. SH664 TaxID=3448125 RepID=UPI003F5CB4A6
MVGRHSAHSARDARRRRMLIALSHYSPPPEEAESSTQPHAAPKLPTSAEPHLTSDNRPDSELTRKLRRLRNPIWVFTGDSLGSPHQKAAVPLSLVSVFARQLRQAIPGVHHTIANTTTPGATIRDIALDYERRIGRFDVDILFLICSPQELQQSAESLIEFEEQCHQLVRQARSRGALVIVNLPPQIDGLTDSLPVDQLIRLEALRAAMLEAGALVVDHWSHWERAAKPSWSSEGFATRQGLEEMTKFLLHDLHLRSSASLPSQTDNSAEEPRFSDFGAPAGQPSP